MSKNKCHCFDCDIRESMLAGISLFLSAKFIVCPACGNKRCPHATDHRQHCTGSNEPRQKGSRYKMENGEKILIKLPPTDFLGNELIVGARVILIRKSYREFDVGIIKSITKAKAKIETTQYGHLAGRQLYHCDMIIHPNQDNLPNILPNIIVRNQLKTGA